MNWTADELRNRGKAKQGRVRNVAPKDHRMFQGRLYASRAEKEYAQQLELQRKAGAIHEWKAQVPYPIKVNGKLVCKCIVDFEVVDAEGNLSVVEVKGWESELYRLKRKLFAACYPRVRYTVVKVGKR